MNLDLLWIIMILNNLLIIQYDKSSEIKNILSEITVITRFYHSSGNFFILSIIQAR